MGGRRPNYEGPWHGSSCAFCFALVFVLTWSVVQDARGCRIGVAPGTAYAVPRYEAGFDHTAPDHDDEAVNQTALIAEMQTEISNLKKRTAEQAFAANSQQIADKHQLPICSNCHKPGHTKEQCFAPGGGLSHYTPLQRQEFLFNKRKVRFEQYQKKHNDNAQNKETAAEATDERDAQIRKLQHQIQELGYVPDVL